MTFDSFADDVESRHLNDQPSGFWQMINDNRFYGTVYLDLFAETRRVVVNVNLYLNTEHECHQRIYLFLQTVERHHKNAENECQT